MQQLHKFAFIWAVALHCLFTAYAEKALRINTDLTAVVGADAEVSKSFLDSDILKNANVLGSELKNFNVSETTHICTREETYVEQLKTPKMQPVRVRSSEWCFDFPPRCSNYKTEMREMVKVQNMTKTRTIRFCCAGYEGNIAINDTVCKPVCHGGCGRGYCQMPDVCSCEAGYTGTHCTQRCNHDRWGVDCKEMCQCQNNAACDNKSGLCHCTAGWIGNFCEQPCPAGTYGIMCRKECSCANRYCHPQTGSCELGHEGINATHVMIEKLNSTIANITSNLDRIAKNIVDLTPTVGSETITIHVQPIAEVVTAKPVPEVIVIKQDEQHLPPKIIVHQNGAGLLENIHSAGAKTPEVIHVITNWPSNGPTHINATHENNLNLAGFGINGETLEQPTQATATSVGEHDANLLTTLLIILLIVLLVVVVGFLCVYRRYQDQKQQVESVLAKQNGHSAAISTVELGTTGSVTPVVEGEANSGILKPLPDLPGFAQMVRNKIEDRGYYDSPPSRHSNVDNSVYAYARKESVYSVVPPKSRKSSPDSHLYDEIRYTAAFQSQQHAANYPSQASYVPHHPSMPVSTQSRSHLSIPPQNSNYLQVPQISHSSQKVLYM